VMRVCRELGVEGDILVEHGLGNREVAKTT